MVTDDIKKELEEEEDEFYGEETSIGHMTKGPVDIDKQRKDIVGDDFDPEAPLNLAEEIEEDEEARHEMPAAGNVSGQNDTNADDSNSDDSDKTSAEEDVPVDSELEKMLEEDQN